MGAAAKRVEAAAPCDVVLRQLQRYAHVTGVIGCMSNKTNKRMRIVSYLDCTSGSITKHSWYTYTDI